MASSTSHSKRPLPKLALALVVAALCIWAASAAYTLWLNAEIKFLTAAGRIKQDYARKMTREHGAKCVVFGGSSGLFSIDGERMLARHRQPTVNMSLHAGCGAKVITEWALSEIKPGDTLVVALEPFLLGDEIEPTTIGTQFCWAMGAPEWREGVLEPKPAMTESSLFALRPGAYHAFTLLGKMAMRRPLMRYEVSDIHPSGWAETNVRLPFGSSAPPPPMSPSAGDFLRNLSTWCQAHQVKVCYALPLAYTATQDFSSFQRKNAAFLLQVSRFIPVLEDRRLGAHADRELFSDTNLHLNTNGVAFRTDEFAAQLRSWKMWSPSELLAASTNGTAGLPPP